MAEKTDTDMPKTISRRLARVLTLTRGGLFAERLMRAFWPLWSVVFAAVAALLMGLHEILSLEVLWSLGLVVIAALLWFALRGLRLFRVPSKAEAMQRLDATLPARPLAALEDRPAIGEGDDGARAVWAAHRRRMTKALEGVRPARPDFQLSRFDPFGLRHIAMLALLVGTLFGSMAQLGSVAEAARGGIGTDVLAAASWEGWVEPPLYTGKPTLYLPDLKAGALELPEGSRVLLRLYGEVGALTLSETVSARIEDVPSAAAAEQDFTIARSGKIAIAATENGGGQGRLWDVAMRPDQPPEITSDGAADISAQGEMSLPFAAADDYGVIGGTARIALDLAAMDRRYGLSAAPEAREIIEVALPMPISGSKSAFEEVLIEDFSKHVWAHLPVTVSLFVEDAVGQRGESAPLSMALPARRFFDPMAAAVIEIRRDLLWSRENGARAAMLLRAISHLPEGNIYLSEGSYLALRGILSGIEASLDEGMTGEERDGFAEALWELALQLEEGDLEDAMRRMQRAREQLQEAMKNGASEAEINRLMQELREATRDYMRERARRQMAEREEMDETEQQFSDDTTMLSQDDIQAMMDRIQELMEQGRMAEAMQALEEFQQMMDNMQFSQGGQGGPQSPGQQAMEGLGETLRDQQELSDEAFGDLQKEFNPDGNRGEPSPGQPGADGQAQNAPQQGEEGAPSGQVEGGQDAGSLADRQEALRNRLGQLRGGLPGQESDAGREAAEALDRAGEAMDRAEDALRDGDLAGALDEQAEAMDEMRNGMRNLGEALAQQQQQGQGRENQQAGDPSGGGADPLGRQNSTGSRSSDGGDTKLQGEDVYRQARDLLDEIRRRAGEAERSEEERSYLRRLLDRF